MDAGQAGCRSGAWTEGRGLLLENDRSVEADPADRILVVAPEPYYEDRGTPIAVRRVLEALSELGYAVDLLTYPVGRDAAPAGVTIHRCANPLGFRSVPVGVSFRKMVLDLSMAASMRRRLAEARYACVHAVEEAAFLAVLLARPRGIPVVYDMQSSLPEQLAELPFLGNWVSQRILRACERWLVRRVDFIVSSTGLAYRVGELAPSASKAEWRYPYEPRHVATEELEVLRRRLDIPPDSPVILYTGNFAPYQGLDLLGASLPEVRSSHPDAVLVVVGASDTAEARELQARVGPEGARALRVLERRPREELDPYYRLADVLVAPRTAGSNLPLKVLDYLAAGGAILATDIPAHRTVLDPSRSLLVPPDPQAVAGGLTRLLSDPELRENLGRNARSFAEEELGWSTFVEAIGRVYASVTAERPDDRPRVRAHGPEGEGGPTTSDPHSPENPARAGVHDERELAKVGTCYGLEVRSDLSFTYLRPGRGTPIVVREEADGDARRPGELVQSWRPTRTGAAETRLYRCGDGYRVELGGGLRFRIGPGGRSFLLSRGADPAYREALLWGTPAAVTMSLRGDLPLHAAAVEVEGGAVLFSGPGGSGKTTLAAVFQQAGHRLLADDLTGCRPGPAPAVLPGPALARLRPDSIERLDLAAFVPAWRHPDRTFAAVDPDLRGDGGPVPLRAVVLLAPLGGPFSLEPVSKAQAIRELWPMCFHLPGEEGTAGCFRQLGEILAGVPVYRLGRSAEWTALPNVVEGIVEKAVGEWAAKASSA